MEVFEIVVIEEKIERFTFHFIALGLSIRILFKVKNNQKYIIQLNNVIFESNANVQSDTIF